MSRRQAYIEALLKNPEFIKTAAHLNGNGIDTNGVAKITIPQLAKTIAHLENALAEVLEDGDPLVP